MTKEEAQICAEENFKKGFNCAQSVLLCFCDYLNFDKDTALRIAQAFGAGSCRLREMCGAVSGMLMALSLLEGSSDPSAKDKKDNLYKIGQDLVKKFEEKNSSYICKELLGLKSKENSPISENRTESYYKKRPCAKLCADAASIFCEYLNSK